MRTLPERYIDLDRKPQKPERPELYAWERNVIDAYKTLSNEEIKQRVAADRLPFAILMTHLKIDYNLGSVLRLANILGGQVFYYGERKYDRRSALGCYHYLPLQHLASIEEVRALREEYSFVGLEQTENSISLPKFDWKQVPRKMLLVIGEEAQGLQAAPEILELCEFLVEIPQRGSIRSLNATSAAAICCYDYLTKTGQI